MTTTEVDQLPYIKAEQVWPIGRFTSEPPYLAEVGPEAAPITVVNWHANNLEPAHRRQCGEDEWRQMSQVGRVLGGAFNYGHLERGRDPEQQIDELNLIVEGLELYVAFHRFDPGTHPTRDFAIAGLGEFIIRQSKTYPDVKRAEPVVVGRDGRYTRLHDVHNGWLFYKA